jgi:phosphonate transport system substrate-binding protein
LYGGLKEAIARQYEHLGLEIVARLDNMPGFAIVVDSSRVDVKTQEIIKKTLLETKKEDYSHWGEDINKGMHPVEEDAYRNFKNMLYESKWEIKP